MNQNYEQPPKLKLYQTCMSVCLFISVCPSPSVSFLYVCLYPISSETTGPIELKFFMVRGRFLEKNIMDPFTGSPEIQEKPVFIVFYKLVKTLHFFQHNINASVIRKIRFLYLSGNDRNYKKQLFLLKWQPT